MNPMFFSPVAGDDRMRTAAREARERFRTIDVCPGCHSSAGTDVVHHDMRAETSTSWHQRCLDRAAPATRGRRAPARTERSAPDRPMALPSVEQQARLMESSAGRDVLRELIAAQRGGAGSPHLNGRR